jgi:thioesterase-3
MIHPSNFKIRTFHTDAFGHVNNSRHLELLEEARWQFAESIGLVELLANQGLGFIIIDMRIRFRSPVVEGDEIRVETSLVALGSASGEVIQTVYKRNESSAALKSTFHFILIDRDTAQSIPIDGAIRELLESVLVRKP